MAWCLKHEERETVEAVVEAKRFAVERLGEGLTGEHATHVHALTERGCSVWFVGDDTWRVDART